MRREADFSSTYLSETARNAPPQAVGIIYSHQFAHLQIVGCPVFNLSICGDRLEDFHQPILFEMDYLPNIS
jgi:hypothetical protein